jgi:hypothetical protein
MCRWIVVSRGVSGVCAASPRLVDRESAVDDRWATYLSWALAVTVAAEDRRNILPHFGSAILPNDSSTFFLFLAAWGRRRTGEALGRLARELWLYFSSGRAAAHYDFDHVVVSPSYRPIFAFSFHLPLASDLSSLVFGPGWTRFRSGSRDQTRWDGKEDGTESLRCVWALLGIDCTILFPGPRPSLPNHSRGREEEGAPPGGGHAPMRLDVARSLFPLLPASPLARLRLPLTTLLQALPFLVHSSVRG